MLNIRLKIQICPVIRYEGSSNNVAGGMDMGCPLAA
jgi:hypothetical protein